MLSHDWNARRGVLSQVLFDLFRKVLVNLANRFDKLAVTITFILFNVRFLMMRGELITVLISLWLIFLG